MDWHHQNPLLILAAYLQTFVGRSKPVFFFSTHNFLILNSTPVTSLR